MFVSSIVKKLPVGYSLYIEHFDCGFSFDIIDPDGIQIITCYDWKTFENELSKIIF